MYTAQFNTLMSALRDWERRYEVRDFKNVVARVFGQGEAVFDVNRGSDVVNPFELVEAWHHGTVTAFSIVVTTPWEAHETRCVFRCPNGQPQEATCTERAEDFRNCWDALEFRCRS